jgi:hypothetical protein
MVNMGDDGDIANIQGLKVLRKKIALHSRSKDLTGSAPFAEFSNRI